MAANNRRDFRRRKPANTIKRFNTPNRDLLKSARKIVDGIQNIKKITSSLKRHLNSLGMYNRQNYLLNTLAAGANEFPNTPVVATMKDPKFLRNLLKTDTIVKGTRLAIGTAKTAKNIGAGFVLNYLSDRFLAPHARRAGIAIGTAAKSVDAAIEKRMKKKK